MDIRFKAYCGFVLRLFLGFILLFAAYSKSVNPALFIAFLSELGVEQALLHFLFVGLVSLEYVLGAMCILGIFPVLIVRCIGCLFSVFAGVTLYALFKNIEASCGCFGDLIETEISFFSVARNILFALAAFYAGSTNTHQFTVSFLIEKYFSDPKPSQPVR